MTSPATDQPPGPPHPLAGVALVQEAFSSSLFCGVAIMVDRLLVGSALLERSWVVLLGAVGLAISTAIATWVIGRSQHPALTPNGAFVLVACAQRSQDDGVALVIVQLAAAAIAGCAVGAVLPVPAAMPAPWSWDIPREIVAACALALTAAAARNARTSALAIALVVFIARAAGARFLGSPAVLLGSAFADLTHGTIARVGPTLAGQAVGGLLGVAVGRALDDNESALAGESAT